jgi:hypothetical protein
LLVGCGNCDITRIEGPHRAAQWTGADIELHARSARQEEIASDRKQIRHFLLADGQRQVRIRETEGWLPDCGSFQLRVSIFGRFLDMIDYEKLNGRFP